VISPHDYSFFLVKEKYLLVIVSVLYRDEIFSLGERIFFEVNSENCRWQLVVWHHSTKKEKFIWTNLDVTHLARVVELSSDLLQIDDVPTFLNIISVKSLNQINRSWETFCAISVTTNKIDVSVMSFDCSAWKSWTAYRRDFFPCICQHTKPFTCAQVWEKVFCSCQCI
jgi:hypothetical protein